MQGTKMRSFMLGLGIVLTTLASFGDIRDAVAADANQTRDALEDAVLAGKDIRVVLDLSQCHVHGTDKSGPPVRGGFHVDGYLIQSDQTIAFSATHFTMKDNKTPVTEFISFKVLPTGEIDAHAIFLNPATYAILKSDEFDCEIGKGETFHW
ncbi:MAG: VirK family protein [Dongiaceae bacterium]